jgi:protein-S-isoprenylcysteine O-methyltransferase Ste14
VNFQATEFEFRNRFWFIGGIFWVAFFLYAVDHVNVTNAFAQLILGSGVDPKSAQFDRVVREILACGTLLLVIASLVRSWAESYLHSAVVHDMDIHSNRLVADGPYRHLRNPLYFGNILLAFGMGLLASRTGYVVLVVLMTLFNYRLILHEEAALLRSQGESYRKYLEAVPRLFPSPWPRVPAGNGRPNWLDGFAGEIFFWAPTLGLAVFAITLRLSYFWAIAIAGFAIYFLQGYLRKRQAPSA